MSDDTTEREAWYNSLTEEEKAEHHAEMYRQYKYIESRMTVVSLHGLSAAAHGAWDAKTLLANDFPSPGDDAKK